MLMCVAAILYLLVYILVSAHHSTAVVTVGFEFPSYTFLEPVGSVGISEVCMVLSGMVGFEFSVIVNWAAGTARGEILQTDCPTLDMMVVLAVTMVAIIVVITLLRLLL